MISQGWSQKTLKRGDIALNIGTLLKSSRSIAPGNCMIQRSGEE